MTSAHYFLLLASSLINHSACLNYSTTSAPSDEMEEGSADDLVTTTILTNVDFMPVDYIEVINSTDQDVSTKIQPLHKHGRRPKIGSSCRIFSVQEKYSMLEGVGGRNQFYMAETPDEASRGFVSPSSSAPVKMKYADATNGEEYTPYCNEECETIRNMLENVLEQRRTRPRLWGPRAQQNDAEPVELDEGYSSKKRCLLETFQPIGNCSDPGNEVTWAHDRLCSMCRGIYVLSENCFPTFINSVLCNQREPGCIFDNISHRAHGTCRPETLALLVLRNHGNDKCEDWNIEQIQIPVACQCLLSKESWLQTSPPEKP